MFSGYNAGEVDRGSLEQQLTFSASMGRQCFNISITDDDEVEEDELFQLTLSGVRRTTGNTTAYQPTATITIIDDDCKFVFMCFLHVTNNNESTKVQNPRRNSYAVNSSYGAMHIHNIH